ncbi:MAG: hypothetical protein ACE37F_03390 [Nannocystaceae bacterium]|nr:hypothetical protein [bacterium]
MLRAPQLAALLAIFAPACAAPEPTTPLSVWAVQLEVQAAAAKPAPAEPAPAARCAPVEPLDVLFIGNSYVIQSDTPGLLATMANDAGVDFNVERLATGGKNFEYHLARRQTKAKLEERSWDVVVLQSHSLDPLRNPDGFAAAGTKLVELVRASSAQPWLFETWARREGHNLYGYMNATVGRSPAVMQARVTERYEALGEATGVPVAKVGTAWLQLVQTHPEIRPHLKDGAHPAEAGAYLSAAVVFTHLTERDPRGVLQPHGAVDAEAAKILQQIAADVVQPPCAW